MFPRWRIPATSWRTESWSSTDRPTTDIAPWETDRKRDRQSERQTDTYSQVHTDTDGHRPVDADTDRHRQVDTDTDRQVQTGRYRQTGTDSQTDRYRPEYQKTPSCRWHPPQCRFLIGWGRSSSRGSWPRGSPSALCSPPQAAGDRGQRSHRGPRSHRGQT